eukprot:scaffold3498_cov112-Isochrysis_galbana.AAC.1
MTGTMRKEGGGIWLAHARAAAPAQRWRRQRAGESLLGSLVSLDEAEYSCSGRRADLHEVCEIPSAQSAAVRGCAG